MFKFKKIYLIPLIALLISCFYCRLSYAADTSFVTPKNPPVQEWAKAYGNPRGISAAACNTNDGGYVLTGRYNLDTGYLVKVDKNGTLLTEQFFPGISILKATTTNDNGYLLLARKETQNSVGPLCLIKTDSLFNVKWQKDYHKYSPSYFYYTFIQQTKNNEFLLAFWRWIIKIDQSGNVVWDKELRNEEVLAGCLLSEGGMLYTGCKDKKAFVAKINDNGTVVWSKYVNNEALGQNGEGYAVKENKNGEIILLHQYAPDSTLYLTCLDKDGNERWVKSYGACNVYSSKSLQIDQDGGYILQYGFTDAVKNINGINDRSICVLKTDSNGNKVWEQKFRGIYGGHMDPSYSELVSTNGGYIIFGSSKLGFDLIKLSAASFITTCLKIEANPNNQELMATVTTRDGEPVPFGTILIKDGNYEVDRVEIQNPEGKVRLPIPFEMFKEGRIKIQYLKNDYYAESEYLIPTLLKVGINPDSQDLVAIVTTEFGTPVPFGTLTVNDDDQEFKIDIQKSMEGEVRLPVPVGPFQAGRLKVEYLENDTFAGSKYLIPTLIKIGTEPNFPNSLKVTTEDGYPVQFGVVVIKYREQEVDRLEIRDPEGRINLPISVDIIEEDMLKVEYLANNTYAGSNYLIPTTMKIETDPHYPVDYPVVVTITTEKGHPVRFGTVVVKEDNYEVYRIEVHEYDQGKVRLHIPVNEFNQRKIAVEYLENDTLAGCKYLIPTVISVGTELDRPDLIKITTEDSKPVPFGTIIISEENHEIDRIDIQNPEGIIRVPFPIEMLKEGRIKVEYLENDTYAGSKYLIPTLIKVDRSNNSILIITQDGRPVRFGTIVIKELGSEVERIEIQEPDGKVKVPFSIEMLEEGRIKVEYLENDTYAGSKYLTSVVAFIQPNYHDSIHIITQEGHPVLYGTIVFKENGREIYRTDIQEFGGEVKIPFPIEWLKEGRITVEYL